MSGRRRRYSSKKIQKAGCQPNPSVSEALPELEVVGRCLDPEQEIEADDSCRPLSAHAAGRCAELNVKTGTQYPPSLGNTGYPAEYFQGDAMTDLDLAMIAMTDIVVDAVTGMVVGTPTGMEEVDGVAAEDSTDTLVTVVSSDQSSDTKEHPFYGPKHGRLGHTTSAMEQPNTPLLDDPDQIRAIPTAPPTLYPSHFLHEEGKREATGANNVATEAEGVGSGSCGSPFRPPSRSFESELLLNASLREEGIVIYINSLEELEDEYDLIQNDQTELAGHLDRLQCVYSQLDRMSQRTIWRLHYLQDKAAQAKHAVPKASSLEFPPTKPWKAPKNLQS